MTTYKSAVFERLFRSRWNPTTGKFDGGSIVMLEDITKEIEFHNQHSDRAVSDRNPANFFKDYIRQINLANRNWPQFVVDQGYTAHQRTGGGQAFEFTPMRPGQNEPFPKLVPPTGLKPTLIQSLSILPLARQLGRKEETWLMQVVANLHIVEAHFAINSQSHNLDYAELLQLSVKQTRAEIDGLYISRDTSGDSSIICIEAKIRDDIYPMQVFAQVEAVRSMRGLREQGIKRIIPLAIKVVARSTIYIAEFPSVPFAGVAILEGEPAIHALYQITPEVNGI